MLNLKRTRPSHWSINKLITANDRIGYTCCRIEMITGHQFRNQGQILRGTGEQRQYGETGIIRKNKKTHFGFLGSRGTSQFISQEQGNSYPSGRTSFMNLLPLKHSC